MTACLRTLRRYRAGRFVPRMGGYVIAANEGFREKALLAWFPTWCVDGLTDRGMIAGGRLTELGFQTIERFES